MTVAELIAELSKIEDQTLDVRHSDSEWGDEALDHVEVVDSPDIYSSGRQTPYVRLW